MLCKDIGLTYPLWGNVSWGTVPFVNSAHSLDRSKQGRVLQQLKVVLVVREWVRLQAVALGSRALPFEL